MGEVGPSKKNYKVFAKGFGVQGDLSDHPLVTIGLFVGDYRTL